MEIGVFSGASAGVAASIAFTVSSAVCASANCPFAA